MFTGSLSVADSDSRLGTGNVIVHPGADLRIQDTANFARVFRPADSTCQSSSTAFGILGFEADFTPSGRFIPMRRSAHGVR